MEKAQVIEVVNKILSKPNYKFHGFDEENMKLFINVEPTPQTQYYHRRETVDLMNDLFDQELEYKVDSDNNEIIIKYEN